MHHIILTTAAGEARPITDPNHLAEVIAEPGNLVWYDIEHADNEDLKRLREVFNFHPLALEDAIHPQKPKIDSYEGYYFIVFYAVRYRPAAAHDPKDKMIGVRQVAMFVGKNYLVTVHKGQIPEVEQTVQRWQNNHQVVGHHIGGVIYALMDAIVDNYFPVIDQLAEVVEGIEGRIFESFDEKALPELFSLKKDLLAMRRVVAPARAVVNVLLRREKPIIELEAIVYFQDVYDHIVRVIDSIDTYRDLLSSALDSYLSIASNRMNQTMRVLTASSIILMSVTLVAGVYGMNFDIMPELRWGNGYPFALGLMVAIALGLVYFFRKKGWL